jgi:hypothetical protein
MVRVLSLLLPTFFLTCTVGFRFSGGGTTAEVVSFVAPPPPPPPSMIEFLESAHTRFFVAVQFDTDPWMQSLACLQSPHGAAPDTEYVDPATHGNGASLHSRSFAGSQRYIIP